MTTTKLNTCGDCAFNSVGYCMRNRMAVKPINYACRHFVTPEGRKAELEARKEERLKHEEMRLNFILTGMYIQATALTQGLEYFDTQFSDKQTEANWRYSRKRAANEIKRCVQKIRDIYQHTFMEDHMQVMTGHGTREFDVTAWDTHEEDGRKWNLLMYHHMDTTWGDDAAEADIVDLYEKRPHIGIFNPTDYKHWGKAFKMPELKEIRAWGIPEEG